MTKKKKWTELSTPAKAGVLAAGGLQVALQAVVLRDLSRRTPATLRGTKRVWVAASFVNFLGPAAYLLWGRTK